jgi:hypothetical protein
MGADKGMDMTRDPTELLSSLNASVRQSFAHEAECNARNENPAGWVFVRLVDQIKAFEDRLNPNEEIGGYLPTGVGADAFHILAVAYSSPDLLIFSGLNQHGRPVHLIQHYTQLSLLLTALPKLKEEEEPRRIGFLLEQNLGQAKK